MAAAMRLASLSSRCSNASSSSSGSSAGRTAAGAAGAVKQLALKVGRCRGVNFHPLHHGGGALALDRIATSCLRLSCGECGSSLYPRQFSNSESSIAKERRRAAAVVTRASSESGHAVPNAGKPVRVRFAPSPTGNLHVGGARTALFNYLFAKATGGKFILRVEDTDLERSTRESEEALLRDLQWLGLIYDEGPNKGGEFGPYRQSERNAIYKEYAAKLLDSGHVYRCFCSDEELEAQREEAKAKNLPPRYTGKWGTASEAEIEAELAKGTPYTYRFRVPQEGSITINDLIRDEVSWSKDTLGDFVVLRSNGQPVYNFCVAVDDAAMEITHVLRGEEHLPNTLRQALIYEALGLPLPKFGHVSLLLATDRSKLSKRHGATSVGQFKEMGYLSEAMVNFLALLGWNDGSEEEIFTVDQIIEKFSIDRITKSAAIFDVTKLGWFNGRYLRALPMEQKCEMFGNRWLKAGLLTDAKGQFVTKATELIQNAVDIVSDGEAALLNILAYPLQSTIVSGPAREFVDDKLAEVAAVVVEAHATGALDAAVDGGHDAWKKFVNGIGKSLKRKGKRLFMPLRIVLTGRMQGPDIGSVLALLKEAEGTQTVTPVCGLVPLGQRIQILKSVDWAALPQELAAPATPAAPPESSPVLAH